MQAQKDRHLLLVSDACLIGHQDHSWSTKKLLNIEKGKQLFFKKKVPRERWTLPEKRKETFLKFQLEFSFNLKLLFITQDKDCQRNFPSHKLTSSNKHKNETQAHVCSLDASFDNNSVTLPLNWTFISHSSPCYSCLLYLVKIWNAQLCSLDWHQTKRGQKWGEFLTFQAISDACLLKNTVDSQHYQYRHHQIISYDHSGLLS